MRLQGGDDQLDPPGVKAESYQWVNSDRLGLGFDALDVEPETKS